jgi:hypothetical protein
MEMKEKLLKKKLLKYIAQERKERASLDPYILERFWKDPQKELKRVRREIDNNLVKLGYERPYVDYPQINIIEFDFSIPTLLAVCGVTLLYFNRPELSLLLALAGIGYLWCYGRSFYDETTNTLYLGLNPMHALQDFAYRYIRRIAGDKTLDLKENPKEVFEFLEIYGRVVPPGYESHLWLPQKIINILKF